MDVKSKKILVYNGEGTSSVDVLINSIIKYLTHCSANEYIVRTVGANDLKMDYCFENVELFVMPGGRDVPYVRDLQGQRISNIKNFVSGGGAYLGLCAGAYLAASYCEFEKGTDMEVCGGRDLKFFPGIARGCVFPGFVYGSESGTKIVNVNIDEKYQNYFDGNLTNKFPCYYNGGCEFVFDDEKPYQSVEVMGKYAEVKHKAAIVCCKVGKGKALLSGVHPEMNFEFIDESKFAGNMDKFEVLKYISNEQKLLFDGMMKLVLE